MRYRYTHTHIIICNCVYTEFMSAHGINLPHYTAAHTEYTTKRQDNSYSKSDTPKVLGIVRPQVSPYTVQVTFCQNMFVAFVLFNVMLIRVYTNNWYPILLVLLIHDVSATHHQQTCIRIMLFHRMTSESKPDTIQSCGICCIGS